MTKLAQKVANYNHILVNDPHEKGSEVGDRLAQ